ncbi:MAG: molybdenum cofactor biosynthesis protein MoaE [Candidatus Eremiobacteraeota bacterium]|nr:molybdenum cofactor biosynthesis protein MoaE [Candidatus Eremiobacteraeota bacterium]MBV9232693.1 molybdenum cofactor biosynthesis protein MoaE [Candidatus Eremiobacteraeota bacterium]
MSATSEVIAVVARPIEPERLEAAMRASDGAVVTFWGRVRPSTADARVVTRLFYEAYEPMARADFQAIAAEVRQRFGDVGLAIVHRVGELLPGEISVGIVAAAPHRAAAFDACRYAIEEVKRRAPIWKKEQYADGSSAWKENPAQ